MRFEDREDAQGYGSCCQRRRDKKTTELNRGLADSEKAGRLAWDLRAHFHGWRHGRCLGYTPQIVQHYNRSEEIVMAAKKKNLTS
jgi:hypothetical protein